MRNNNGFDAGRVFSMKMTWAVLLIAVLFLSGVTLAAEKKSGRNLILTLKNGSVVKGELLTVERDRLILFDSIALTDADVRIGDVAQIKVRKKSSFLSDLGTGILIGGATGAVLGLASGDDKNMFFPWTAAQKALAYGLGLGVLGGGVGGIVGAISGESIDLGSISPPDLDGVLGKLKTYARVSGDIKPAIEAGSPPAAPEESKPAEKEANPPVSEKSGQVSIRTISVEKYSRFHLSLGPGYFLSSGTGDLENLIRDIDFTGTRSRSAWIFGSTTIKFPRVEHDARLLLNDLMIEYSLSRKFALGLAYVPLGEHSVSGWRTIPNKDFRSYYLPETFFNGSYKGDLVFLTASAFPIPDAFLKKTSLKLTAGVGLAKWTMEYSGSDYEYFNNSNSIVNTKSFSKSGVGALLSAELVYFFNPHWSLGVNAAYKYIPVRCSGFSIDCPYSYYDAAPSDGGSLIYDSLRVDIPSRKYNLGGLGIGFHFGWHF